MTNKEYKLVARVKSSNPEGIRPILESLVEGKGTIKEVEDESGGFVVEGTIKGSSTKELNRSLLSSLRTVERKTTLRAEWTNKNVTERFFDYVLKKTIK